MDFFYLCLSLHTVMYVSCSRVFTCRIRVDLLAFLYVMFLSFPIRCPV